ncbi:N-6 DNA methylase, partial [Rahnella bruchi]
MNSYTLAKRRELGAYYTPPELSQALANWAIRSVEDSLLEPSFGGCGFLESCVTRLRQLGNDCPEQNLYGVDIDETAFEILAQKFQISDISNKFIFDDFINVKPDDFTQKNFDIVIGNPPYISMHNMTSKQRISCQDVLDKSIYNERTLGRNSSLWAFFLLHSLSFLNENGRVAWVLPSSLLHAYYASALINIHKKHFSKIKVIKINERFFKDAGADEASVIFVCEGFSSKEVTDGLYNVYSAENVNSLNIILNDRSVRISSKHDNFKLNLLPSEILLTYENISTQSNC